MNSVKATELKLIMFLHEHNLPFSLMDHLTELIKSVSKDSQVIKELRCARTKATVFFSLILDETTDISTQKSLAVVVRFYDNDWKDHFLGLLKVKSCAAEDLYNQVNEYLKSLDIPINNLIGLAADNAAVMMGNIRGIQARFKEVLPNIFVLGCVCHSFHLCSSAAAKKLPRSLEDFIRGVYNYFSHSSKRLEKLSEFQSFVNIKPNKLLHPSQTRWLSLQAASEKPKIHMILKRVTDLYRSILRNYIKKEYIDNIDFKDVDSNNPRHFMPLEKIYYGANVEILISQQTLDKNDLHNFRIRALDFYVELSTQVKSRFKFNDPVLKFVSNFEPKVALSGKIGSIVVDALQFFPAFVVDPERLNTEWRLLADLSELTEYAEYSFQDFWNKVFNVKNEADTYMFPNISRLVKGLFSLPHSSASAERVFSQLNLLKTKCRNRLDVSTCESILHAKGRFYQLGISPYSTDSLSRCLGCDNSCHFTVGK
ncbi:hypothetical protein NQ315_000523 [Exocentrus adspersus]|uniref:HAT C-terminal dimerisation domain-containing protein n=1 Tax=Exocentrus adspersus TaxID=1586481 RepID=A0AAV8VCY7_9CUCU|nr:hypothetical protein NQ315_000523 [Exocentrus adspersus]